MGAGSHFAFWESSLTYEGESIYNYLQVKENEQEIVLSTNVMFGVQSVTRKDNALSGMYYDYAMAAPLMAGSVEHDRGPHILILGNGSGTYARQCLRYFPESDITAVEIDQSITDLAYEYFDMPKEVKVTTYDGRAYLQADKEKYDVIMVDAYQDISIPFQMASVEFFTLVREHLNEGGVMVVNMNMRASSPDSINDYLTDTIASVFPCVATIDVEGYTNRELFASEARFDQTFSQQSAKISDQELKPLMQKVGRQMTDYKAPDTTKAKRILTDDRAPVEMLSMRAIDEIIAGELAYYKKVFKEEGLSGLMDAL